MYDETQPLDLTGASRPRSPGMPRAYDPAGAKSPRGASTAAPKPGASLGQRRLEALDRAARAGQGGEPRKPLDTPIGGAVDPRDLGTRYGPADPRRQPSDGRGGATRTPEGNKDQGLFAGRRGGDVTKALPEPTGSGQRTPREAAPKSPTPREAAPAPGKPREGARKPDATRPDATKKASRENVVDEAAHQERKRRLRERERQDPTGARDVRRRADAAAQATTLGLSIGWSAAWGTCPVPIGGYWSPYWNSSSCDPTWSFGLSWCWGVPAYALPCGSGWSFNYWWGSCGNWGSWNSCSPWASSWCYSPWNYYGYACAPYYGSYYGGVIYEDREPDVVYVEVPAAAEEPAPAEPAPAAEPAAGEGVIHLPVEAVPLLQGPQPAPKHLDLGDLAWREGRYADAVHHYAQALEAAPREGVLHLILSDALFATGDYHYAAFSLRKALELDPDLVHSTLDKHTLYPKPEVFDQQLAVLEQYVADHPIDDDARLLLAANYLFGQRPAQAVDVLQSPYAVALRETPSAKLVLARAQELRDKR